LKNNDDNESVADSIIEKMWFYIKIKFKSNSKKCELELINSNELFMIKQFLDFILNHYFCNFNLFYDLDKINVVIRYI
jgi:hypothetical protein